MAKIKNKYLLGVIVELIFFLFYIIFPKFALIGVGAAGTQINILGLLLFFVFHMQIGIFRKKQINEDDTDLKKVDKYIEMVRFALVLLAVYRLQVALGAGI